MIYFEKEFISARESRDGIKDLCEVLSRHFHPASALLVPPDFTRFDSRGGEITSGLYALWGKKVSGVLPATGTHYPVTDKERQVMFPGIPPHLFLEHNWTGDLVHLGGISSSEVKKVAPGTGEIDFPFFVNPLILEEKYDLVVSVGQVVPHEVTGMSNYTKNIFVGLGGKDTIDKSHFLGALIGIEKIIGQVSNPVRDLLNRGGREFLEPLGKVLYILTVVEPGGTLRGLFAGDDEEVYFRAAELSSRVNVFSLPREISKAVVWLPPEKIHSTWVGNKAIYRTIRALNKKSELFILAPGVEAFGENKNIDYIIREYGYLGRDKVLNSLDSPLGKNLCAAAHLIHGSVGPEMKVVYCTEGLSRKELEGVGYNHMGLKEALKAYPPESLRPGFNVHRGEEIYFIPDPTLGVWSCSKE